MNLTRVDRRAQVPDYVVQEAHIVVYPPRKPGTGHRKDIESDFRALVDYVARQVDPLVVNSSRLGVVRAEDEIAGRLVEIIERSAEAAAR